MKVTNWISYSEAENFKNNNVGGLGGFFNFQQKGMRWKDYIDIFTEDDKFYVEALRQEILDKNLRFCGNDHQADDFDGTPLFKDNTVATYSYRAWGDLMAAIWSEKEDKDYCYMNFYMSNV